MKYDFPENLYTDVLIESRYSSSCILKDGIAAADRKCSSEGVLVRVYDGNMWYKSSLCSRENIQQEIYSLSALAAPNVHIYDDPEIKLLETNVETRLIFDGDKDIKKVSREDKTAIVNSIVSHCVTDDIPEIKQWFAGYSDSAFVTEFYSSKGAALVTDKQCAAIFAGYAITVNGVTTSCYKEILKMTFPELYGHEQEIISERDRFVSFAKNATDITPGEYVCVLSPQVTALFTHESFGHKSEADYMLTDKTLLDEWVIGKRVAADSVSICDRGDLLNHGYTPYDDEGTAAKTTYLIKSGILTGRLHSAHTAAIMGETLTGSCRGGIVRMTNTFMEAGSYRPEDIIADTKEGIYIRSVSCGTGSSAFTMSPTCCYMIRDGRLSEPVRVNVVTGSVFETLFDIDRVGNDLKLFDESWCEKWGQTAGVSMGGPTIRVKKLNVR